MAVPHEVENDALGRVGRLSQEEHAVLIAQRPLLEQLLPVALDRLYADIRKCSQAIKHFRDEESLKNAHRAQLEHWRFLISGNLGDEYERRAKRIGVTHARIGLDHRLYAEAYALVLADVVERLIQDTRTGARLDHDAAAHLSSALIKGALTDLSLITTAYLESAEAESASKSRFLASLSNDLRNPLNAVIGYSEMAMEELPHAGEAAKHLHEALGAAQRLLRQVDRLLELARIESGAEMAEVELFDPAALMHTIARHARPSLELNGNRLTLSIAEDIGPIVNDPDKLSRCLLAALGNAARFTSNGEIFFRLSRRTHPGGPMLAFEVSDTGAGIAPDQLARMLAPRTSAPVGDDGRSAGLGLALTRALARLLGGDMDIDSTQGQGTTVTLWVPYTQPGSAS